jgi:hypothetical protein
VSLLAANFQDQRAHPTSVHLAIAHHYEEPELCIPTFHEHLALRQLLMLQVMLQWLKEMQCELIHG